MPQVVEPLIGEPGLPDQRLEPVADCAPAERCPDRSREDVIGLDPLVASAQPLLELADPVSLESGHDRGRQAERTAPLLRLGLADPELALNAPEPSADMDDAGRQVDVAPAEGQQFALTRAGREAIIPRRPGRSAQAGKMYDPAKGYPRVLPSLWYRAPAGAVSWLGNVLGPREVVRFVAPDRQVRPG